MRTLKLICAMSLDSDVDLCNVSGIFSTMILISETDLCNVSCL